MFVLEKSSGELRPMGRPGGTVPDSVSDEQVKRDCLYHVRNNKLLIAVSRFQKHFCFAYFKCPLPFSLFVFTIHFSEILHL